MKFQSAVDNYTNAESPVLQQATGIDSIGLGEAHRHFAESLNNLAGLYQEMDDYAIAEPLLRQAMEIWRRRQPSKTG